MNSRTGSTMRGSGAHHRMGWSALNHGNTPRLYAATRLSTVNSPPAARSPGAGVALSQALSWEGRGSPASSQGSCGVTGFDRKRPDCPASNCGNCFTPNKKALRSIERRAFSIFMAPRPGLEPGTYGLTVSINQIFWDAMGRPGPR